MAEIIQILEAVFKLCDMIIKIPIFGVKAKA